MRNAIIGTGFIAQTHKKTLLALGEQISLVVGSSREKAAAFAAGTGAVIADHLDKELLQDIDCVFICTPPSEHATAVRLCLQEGKHILCEKPLSLDTEEAKKLAEMAKASAAVTAVDFNNRFYAVLRDARDMISTFKGPLLIRGHYCQEFHMMPCPMSWRFTDPLRATSEIGSHLINLMDYLTGRKISKVSANFFNLAENRYVKDGMLNFTEGEPVTIKNEDAVTAQLIMEDGSIASMFLSEIAPGKSNDLSIEITDIEKTVAWCAERPYTLVYSEKNKGMTMNTNAFGGGFNETFQDVFAAFFESIASGKLDVRLTSFEEAAENTAICNALKESADRGGSIIEII